MPSLGGLEVPEGRLLSVSPLAVVAACAHVPEALPALPAQSDAPCVLAWRMLPSACRKLGAAPSPMSRWSSMTWSRSIPTRWGWLPPGRAPRCRAPCQQHPFCSCAACPSVRPCRGAGRGWGVRVEGWACPRSSPCWKRRKQQTTPSALGGFGLSGHQLCRSRGLLRGSLAGRAGRRSGNRGCLPSAA